MQTPPPLPAKSSDWWSRNWKWFVPLISVASVLAVGGFIFSVFAVMRSSDAYTGAVARAKADPTVISAIGSPIEGRFFLSGNIHVSGSSGSADLTIPIEGPKGQATIFVNARKADGVWHYPRLIVQLAADGRRVDLSEK